MYFDWCDNPVELRNAIGKLLTGATFNRGTISGPGSHVIPIIGPSEHDILKHTFLEAVSAAEKLRKRCPILPVVPDTQCLPLEGIGRMVAWCGEAGEKWMQWEQKPKGPGLAGMGRGQESGTGRAAEPTDTERNILEALGDKHMTGPVLLKKAGYDYSSHYRAILSNLVKRGILGNDRTGYYRRNR